MTLTHAEIEEMLGKIDLGNWKETPFGEFVKEDVDLIDAAPSIIRQLLDELKAAAHLADVAERVQKNLGELCGGGGLVTELYEALVKYRKEESK